MRMILTTFVVLPLAACGGGDTSELTQEELAAAPDASTINFGTDSGDWANDGECDDPRFKGPGMTATPLLDEDTLADATDCRAAYERGELILID